MRCKACNSPLSSFEIIWLPLRKEFEELCRRCRDKVGVDNDISLTHQHDLFECEVSEDDDQ